jgi:predicted aldo/keto reductase-like oxidoreductase
MDRTRRSIDRRSFLKDSLIGAAGLGALSAWPAKLAGQTKVFQEPQGDAKKGGFIYRKLGKTGITLPIVSFGVMNSDNETLIRASLDAGLPHLDTAHGYMRGRNEEQIGRVLQGRPRESFFIATKVPGEPVDGRTRRFSPETKAEPFLERLNLSLKRLGLEYVDILYIHNVIYRDSVLFEPLMKALETAKKSGRARFVGVSTHSNEHEVIRAAIESKFYDVVLSGYNFAKSNLVELDKAIGEAAQAGLGIIAMKTLAGGYFDRERQQPVPAKAALKFALNNPNITSAIPGMTSLDQLETNLQVVKDIKLTDEERKSLRIKPEDGGLYCQGCNTCLAQCPKDLPLPSLMRSYMYAYGYRNLGAAYDLVSSLEVPTDPCGDCGPCRVRCTMGFNLKARATDIARIQAAPADLFV